MAGPRDDSPSALTEPGRRAAARAGRARDDPAAGPPAAAAGLVSGAGITLIGTAVGGLMLLFNEVLAARFLGLPAYGLFALALVLAKVGDKLAVLGLHVAALRFLAPARARGDGAALAGTVLAASLPVLLVGSALAAALSLAAPWLADHVFAKPAAAPYLRVTVLAIPGFALTEILGNVARGFGRMHYYVIARHFVPQFVLTVVLVAAWSLGLDGSAAAWGFVAAGAVAALVALALAWHAAAPEWRGHAPRVEPGALYRYAAPVLLNTLLYVLIGWSDLFLLGVMASSEAAGQYRACTQAVIGFDMISVAFNAAAANPFALAAAGHATLEGPYVRALRGLVAVATPLLVLLLLTAGTVLSLLGPGFAAAAPALRILACASFVNCCLGVAGFALVMTGHQRVETANALVAAVLGVALNLLLIPRLGITGAALASATSLLCINGLRVGQLRRRHGVGSMPAGGLRLLVAGIAGGGLLAALLPAVANPGPGAAIVRIGAVVVGAAGGVWWFGLRPGDRAELRRSIGRRAGSASGVLR